MSIAKPKETGYNRLFKETLGYIVSQCIYTVARLKVADIISGRVQVNIRTRPYLSGERGLSIPYYAPVG